MKKKSSLHFEDSPQLAAEIFKVTKDTLFIDVLRRYPRVIKSILKAYRLPCLECKGLAQETIENVALSNGLNVEELIETIKAGIEGENEKRD